MGTMTKLRENTGVILWILVIAFGLIWVLQDSGGLDFIGTNPTGEIIVVNGDPITYEEYSRALDNQYELYRQRLNGEVPPQLLDQAESQVYTSLIDNKLREHEMDRLGIGVSDQEVFDMVLGATPHPIVTAYFSDGQGGVDQALLQNFIDDPAANQQLIQLEEYLRAERRQEKLNNLISSTIRLSEEEILDAYRQQNLRVDAEFVALQYARVSDDEIEVTDRDLNQYYNAHKEEFLREQAYTLRYAVLSKDPTPEDSLVALNDIEKLKNSFASTTNDSLFLAREASARPYSSAFFSLKDLDAPISDALIEDLTPGRIIGPLVARNQVHLIKILEVQEAEEPVIKARHILLQGRVNDDAARTEALTQARDLKQQLDQGADFAALAREHSDDQSGREGGLLGWIDQERMDPAFSEAAFSAPVNRVIGPVTTPFGYHLVEVLARSDQDVRLADYAQPIQATVETLNNVQERLDDLAFYAGETGNFDAEAERLGLELTNVQVEKDQGFIPGLGASRALTRFLEGAEEGDVSEVIELNTQFLVASVAEIIPEGYRPFEEVKPEIEPRVRREKKREVQRQRMETALNEHGFDGLAEALDTQVRPMSNITFTSVTVPGVGREPIFAGTALGLEEGATSGVVEGENGVFVIRVKEANEPDEPTEADLESIRRNLLNQRREQVQREWIRSLRDLADIEDKRRFYNR